MNASPTAVDLAPLLTEYDAARMHSLALVADLDPDQIAWRPHDDSSSIAWHLGHQAFVNHVMVRNLTAAEPMIDAAMDAVFDSATPEPARGSLPPLDELLAYRRTIAERTHATMERIASGDVGAPVQLSYIAEGLLRAVINHEYQHDTWVSEVRAGFVSSPAPAPSSVAVVDLEGYWFLPG